MVHKEKHHVRTDSFTSVILSPNDITKVVAASVNDTPHYATNNRLERRKLLEKLEEVRNIELLNEKRRASCQPAHLVSARSADLVDSPTRSRSVASLFNPPQPSATRRQPTLRKPTLKQQLHRIILWPKYMYFNCLSNMYEAVSIMIRNLRANNWQPSKVFEKYDPLALSSDPAFGGKKAPGYSCQITFTNKFQDRKRFQTVYYQLCKDSGMEDPESMAVLQWNDSVQLLNEYSPEVNDIPGTHYIPNSRSYYAEGGRFKKYHVAVDMYESDETTIMQAHLPGRVWDGTSCFNFCKELVHRYYSDDKESEESPVFKANDLIHMKQESREQIDNFWNLFRWMVWVPYNVYSNQSGLCWQKASAEAGIDGYKEIPKELCHVNLNVEQSKKFSAALKKHKTNVGSRGIYPTSALVFAGIHSFKQELGEFPFNVVMQASLQTRSFEPSFKERRFVGDWLVGILHRVRTLGRRIGVQAYTMDDAQRFYEDLIQGLDTTDAAVRDAFYSRVLGKLKGGAAAFEKTPCFPGHSRLNDSLFFNNYGYRTIHPDSGCVGFNWSGAGKVGINCILINGRICCSIASTQLPLAKVEEIRDTFKKILMAIIDGENGDEFVQGL